MKRFSKEWFLNKLKQYRKMTPGYPKKLTSTKGYKPNVNRKSTKEQRIESLYKLAKEKGVKL